MPVAILVLSAITCLLFLSLPASAGDLKIVTRQSFNGRDTSTSTQYLSSARSRFQSANGIDNVEGHHLADIVHYGDVTNRNFILDLDAHEYTTYETDKRGIALTAKSHPAPPRTGGQLDIWIESRDTGERQELFGHTARHIITKERRVPGAASCSTASETEIDGWYIDYSVLPVWRRPEHVGTFLVGGDCRDKIEVHKSGVEPGFAIKSTSTSKYLLPSSHEPVTSVSVLEVIEFSEAPLDPALFEVPPDFQQVTDLTNMNRQKRSTAWERFKNWTREIFR